MHASSSPAKLYYLICSLQEICTTSLQENRMPPLHLAACLDQAGIMTELLRHGADIDAKDFTVANVSALA